MSFIAVPETIKDKNVLYYKNILQMPSSVIFVGQRPGGLSKLVVPTCQEVLAAKLASIRKNGAELDQREFPCQECERGEYVQVSGPSPSTGIMVFECNSCSHEVRFP